MNNVFDFSTDLASNSKFDTFFVVSFIDRLIIA